MGYVKKSLVFVQHDDTVTDFGLFIMDNRCMV